MFDTVTNADSSANSDVVTAELAALARRLPPGYRLSLVLENGATIVQVCTGDYPWSRRLIASDENLSSEILPRATSLVEAAWADAKHLARTIHE
ncbi:MAG: hypothetical protein DHS20C11_14650 [Lysobacteraceae bacterium]|nr:MAG: hypothetical protein DHS20C11_14650 [Xanthomonadaceae bacterium]